VCAPASGFSAEPSWTLAARSLVLVRHAMTSNLDSASASARSQGRNHCGCRGHRQEFILEGTLLSGGGGGNSWSYLNGRCKPSEQGFGQKSKEIWRNFLLKMYFWASWRGYYPSAPLWLRPWSWVSGHPKKFKLVSDTPKSLPGTSRPTSQ